MKTQNNNLLELLNLRATTNPEDIAYQFLDSQGELNSYITYEQLYNRALSIASKISQKDEKPERVLLLFPQGLDFTTAFWGTLFSGALVVPVNFSVADQSSEQKVKNFQLLVEEVHPDIILTTSGFSGLMHYLMGIPAGFNKKVITIEEIDDDNPHGNRIMTPVTNDMPAYIQYTNGTTSFPQGVIITHGNIMHNCEQIKTSFQLTSSSRSLSWLPYHHHLGLAVGIILPIYTGFPGYLSSQFDFVNNPVSWLKAITKHKITLSGAPNFSYDMCLENITAEDKKILDLSSWKVAYNSGESIKQDTLDGFYEELKVCGFNKSAIYTCYSLSETTAFIAVNNESPTQRPFIYIELEQLKYGKVKIVDKIIKDKICAVNCGHSFSDTHIEIVNPETHFVCGEQELGEIWIKGDSNGAKYWNQPTKTKTIFQAHLKDEKEESYLRTGDLGFIYEGCIYIIGKIIHKPIDNRSLDSYSDELSNSKEAFGEAAVIGMAGIFPQSDNCEQFFNNIVAGKNLISEIPGDRWDWQEIYGTPDNQSYKTNIKWGGFINDIKTFDADFFNISPIEARYMDPMQRKLIQVVWQTIENAGYKMSDISGKNVGVFIGIGTFDYLELVSASENGTHAYVGTGITHCMAANRISYLFDFKGPSESIDTACSSTLVALHRAVMALKNKECEMAVVGGCNAILCSSTYVTLSNAGMLSEDGKCKTFDKAANGYVRGEGIGAILLKSQKQSIKDKDYIYGVVKGTAENHGGHTTSLTAPNPIAQSQVIIEAFKQAGITADTINYIEVHGTGTALGDPIEINGLKMAFENSYHTNNIALKDQKYCGLGSVKTNIGHLEAAAGIAGTIKVLLAMKNKTIPPHLHLNTVNPEISLEDSPFYIVGNKAREWEQRIDNNGNLIPRRAGISSFGFGGVNSHVVLEEYQNKVEIGNMEEKTPMVFVLSAKTKTVLTEYAHQYLDFLKMNKAHLGYKNFIFTLQMGREAMEFRLAITACNWDELISELSVFLDEQEQDLISNNKNNTIFYNQINSELSRIVFNPEDEDIKKLADYYINQKDMTNLAQLWIIGANIEWQKLYSTDDNIQRIPVPTYPFKKTEHWVNKATTTHTKLKKDNLNTGEFFDYKWIESPINPPSLIIEEGQLVQFVLFCDQQGISDKFIGLLETKKMEYYKIEAADTFKKVDENYYHIDPYKKSDYDNVLIDITSKSKNTKTFILNFWPLDYKELSDYKLLDLEKAIEFTCISALNLMQSIINQQIVNQQVWFLCSNVQPIDNESLNLLPAALWGFTKSIIQEHPGILRSIIDIGQLDTHKPEELFNEVNHQTTEGEIVYRNQKRYVSRIVPAKVNTEKELNIRKDGTYLITGGLGSLGLQAGKWLSQKKAKKILLLGRSGLDSNKTDVNTLKKLELINLMKSNGSEVEILVADVTKKNQLEEVCRKYIDNKELRGIFHTAGTYQSNLVKDMTYLDFNNVIKAKTHGTWNLHEITKNYKLDYFVLYSSCVSIWGTATAAHYGAANYFLDTYAHYCKITGLSATSINWGGMWENSNTVTEENGKYMKSLGIQITHSEHGLDQLEAILRSGETQKVVAPIKWDTFLPVMNFKRKNMIFEYINSSKLGTQTFTDQESNELESSSFIKTIADLPWEEQKKFIIETLSHLLKEVLGINGKDDISTNIGFFELGLDSLTSIDLKNKLQKKLCIDISTTLLFDCNTIELLADYIIENHCIDENDNLIEEPVSLTVDATWSDPLTEEDITELDQIDKNELLDILKKEMENI